MSKEEKIAYIIERLQDADEFVLDQIYDFLGEVEYWKEVIQISNLDKGGMTDLQIRGYIADALDTLPSDVLKMIYRIIFSVESGLE